MMKLAKKSNFSASSTDFFHRNKNGKNAVLQQTVNFKLICKYISYL